MTADAVVARIKAQLASQGIAWREGGRDTFKAGTPETEVRGIATTGMVDLRRPRRGEGRQESRDHADRRSTTIAT